MLIGSLLGVMIIMGIVFVVWSEGGSEEQEPPQPRRLDAVAPGPGNPQATVPSLDSLQSAWLQPLFNPDRKPDPQRSATVAEPGLEGLKLTGVVLNGTRSIALFKQPDGRNLVLKEGMTLTAGWRVFRIEARQVEVRNVDDARVLQLSTPRLPAVPVPLPNRIGRP
jgi:hypothetical protein